MKVRFLTSVATADQTFDEGEIYELSHERAHEFALLGWCETVDIESTARAAPENAARPRPRTRT